MMEQCKEKLSMRSCNGLLEIDENYAFHCKVDVLVMILLSLYQLIDLR